MFNHDWLLIFAGLLNVLFVVADDLRPSIGCYGETSTMGTFTPNLDKLAKESLLFENAHVQVSECERSTTGKAQPS